LTAVRNGDPAWRTSCKGEQVEFTEPKKAVEDASGQVAVVGIAAILKYGSPSSILGGRASVSCSA
jgi:hypothetical protein